MACVCSRYNARPDWLIVANCDSITKSRCVRNLGAWFNDTFDMSQHVTNLCSASFFQPHNIRRIGKYLTQEVAATLVHFQFLSHVELITAIAYYMVYPTTS